MERTWSLVSLQEGHIIPTSSLVDMQIMLVVDTHPIRVTIETFAEYITRRLKSIDVGNTYKHAKISTKNQEDVGLG